MLYELIQKVRRGEGAGKEGCVWLLSCVCPMLECLDMHALVWSLFPSRGRQRVYVCMCVLALASAASLSSPSGAANRVLISLLPPPPFPSSPFTGEEPPAHLPGADCLGELHLRGGHGVLGLRAHQQGKQKSCCDAVGLLEKERKMMVAPAAGQGVPSVYTPLHLPHSLVPSFLFFFLCFYNPHRPSRRHLSLNPSPPPPSLPSFLHFSMPKASPAPVTTAATKWWTKSRTCAATGPCKPTVWTRRSGA